MRRVRIITDVEAECIENGSDGGRGITPGSVHDVIWEGDHDLSVTVRDDNLMAISLFSGDFEWVEEGEAV